MRFKQPQPVIHSYGEMRTQSWFALGPITIEDETRWLERVTVEYVWAMGNFYMGDPDHWAANRFIDQD